MTINDSVTGFYQIDDDPNCKVRRLEYVDQAKGGFKVTSQTSRSCDGNGDRAIVGTLSVGTEAWETPAFGNRVGDKTLYGPLPNQPHKENATHATSMKGKGPLETCKFQASDLIVRKEDKRLFVPFSIYWFK